MSFIKMHLQLLRNLDTSAAKAYSLKDEAPSSLCKFLHVFPTAGNPVHNDDDAFVTFSTPESSSRTCEAGYAKVVSPDRKGYAVLKPTLGRTRSDYQQLLRPCEGMKCSGIFI